MGKWRQRILGAAVVVTSAIGGVVATESTVGAAANWSDGLIVETTITPCWSIIFGTPAVENGAGLFVGYLADVQAPTPLPTTNTTFYVHVYVAGLGNTCVGQRFVPDIWLPSGVTIDYTQPAYCITKYGVANSFSGSPDCPSLSTNLVPSIYGATGGLMYVSNDTQNARTWPLPQGATWEFQFPVKSNRVVANEMMYSFTKFFDGQSNLTLAAQVPLYVFGAGSPPQTPPVTISYPTPSTTKCDTVPGTGGVVPRYGFCSTAQFNTYGRSGTGRYELGTAAGSYTQAFTFALAANEGWTVSSDWDEVGITAPTNPGTTYHWRACFTETGSANKVCGADQTFVPPPATCDGKAVTVSIGLGQTPTSGSDVIAGTPASEVIDGLGGNDTFCGNGGNDTFRVGTGNDRVIGGTGRDTIDFTNNAIFAGVGIVAALGPTTGAGSSSYAGFPQDTFTGIENFIGTQFGDVLTGDGGNNFLSGGAGNDSINGGAGNDAINPGTGNDSVAGGVGTDTVGYPDTTSVKVFLAQATAQNTGGAGTDTISQVENLTGSPGNDTLAGTTGPNRIDGGAGNDVLAGLAGNDVLLGGAGVDTVGYGGTAAVKVNLALTTAQNTVGQGIDTLNGFESVVGSNGNDTLVGTSGPNTITGGPGNDVLNGGAGIDTVVYSGTSAVRVNLALTTAQNTVGQGTDTVLAFENVIGSNGNDLLTGNAANNVLIGGPGNDVMNGGAGVDAVSYATSAVGVKVTLGTTAAQNTIGAGADTIVGFENVVGSPKNDVISGNAGNNRLDAGAGTDSCNGGAGTDVAVGCESVTGIP